MIGIAYVIAAIFTFGVAVRQGVKYAGLDKGSGKSIDQIIHEATPEQKNKLMVKFAILGFIGLIELTIALCVPITTSPEVATEVSENVVNFIRAGKMAGKFMLCGCGGFTALFYIGNLIKLALPGFNSAEKTNHEENKQ